jgi:membrane-bound lytic murein transglycosylase B
MVCGPALDTSSDNAASAAPAAAIGVIPGPAEATGAAVPATTAPWSGPLPIRPSRIAKAQPAGGDTAPLATEAVTLGTAGATGALGIPLTVLQAYRLAAAELKVEQPSCKLPWWLLAGIGRTESGHAESGRLIADGTTRGRILGPRLNGGIVGDAIITDTDGGRHDGDTVYDRAVGPMQFIPTTWERWGADANADGKTDPNNIFDATLAAGRYLCAHDRDLSTGPGLRAAVLSYNYSAPYLATVLAWGAAYRDGASALPNSPLPVISDVTKVRPPQSSRPPKPVTKPSKAPSTAPTAAATSSSRPSPSAPASSSAAESSSASATASPTASSSASCPSASPSPTQSSSSGSVNTAVPQSMTSKPGTAKPSTTTATPSGSTTPSGPATATSSGSRVQSATAAQSVSSTSTSASSSSASASASPTLSDCAP